MKLILNAFMVLMSISAFAQLKTVTGKVIDEKGEPILGVTVIVKGTSRGAVTDFDGEYSVEANEGDVIAFSYVGIETVEQTVKESNKLNVTLHDFGEELDEVVVIGYGTVKKSDLTGSVSSVKVEEIVKTGAVSLDQALAGRAAGVVVTQNSGMPGAGASITVRGVSTISGSEPLYVIDGVPMENENEESLNGTGQDSGNLSPLSLINPADIQSVEILKDASATAIYGSRGSNGVVLITTKSGEVGKGTIQISTDYALGSIPNFIDVFDANQYWISRNEAQINGGDPGIRETLLDSAHVGLIPTKDELSTILSTATASNTNIKFSGGSKDLRYILSTNILDQEGIIRNTNFTRMQTSLNLNANVNKSLKLGTRLNYSYVDTDQQSTNSSNFTTAGTSNVIRRALLSNPTFNETDDVLDEENDEATALVMVDNNKWESKMYQILASIYLDLKLSKTLSFKTTFTHQNRFTKQRFYQNNLQQYSTNITKNQGRSKTGDSQRESNTNTNQLNYRSNFNKNHVFDVLLGQSLEWRDAESIKTQNNGFANDLLTWYAPETATNADPESVSYSDSKLISFFGRINYNFKSKFLFTLTGRYDGSSKFASNNKWAFFPAGAFAYKMSKEQFIRNIDAISDLKFRVSYGRTGNQAVREYQSLAQLAPDAFVFGTDSGESSSAIYYSSQIPNVNLKWEISDQFDVGFDMGFLKNRISITADYYNKITNDLLIANNKIPAHSGQTQFTQNYGTIQSNGFEFSMSARVIHTQKMSWNLNGNFSVGKAIIKDLVADNIQSGISFGRVSTGTQRLIIGEEIGTFYGWKTAGISQFNDFVEFQGLTHQEQIDLYNQDRTATFTYVDGYEGGRPVNSSLNRPGEQLYEDLDNDQVISELDKKVIGSAQPDINFGINNSFRFGNLDFSFFIDGQQGQEIANVMNWNLLTYSSGQQLELVKDAWTPSNQSTAQPKVSTDSGWGNTLPFSDRYVEDASFIRLQNITVGYRLPRHVLEKINLHDLRVFGSLSNIYTFTKYTGFNPDVNLGGRNNLTLGHDNAGYPNVRTLRFGVSIKI